MFSKQSLGFKLPSCAGTPFALTVALSDFGFSSNTMFKDLFDTTVDRTGAKRTLAERISLAREGMVADQRAIVLVSARFPHVPEINAIDRNAVWANFRIGAV